MKWTSEMIERELRQFISDSPTFPTARDLRDRGRNDLACAIAKDIGFKEWAARLAFIRKPSDSDFGWKGEAAFMALCEANRLRAERPKGIKSPWDIVIEGALRVDVKNARFAEYGACRGWFYRMGKSIQADLAILMQDDTGDFYAIPWWRCPTSNITISRGGGKYAEFINDWPLIRKMIGVRMAEMAIIDRRSVGEVA